MKTSRRSFVRLVGAGAAAMGFHAVAHADDQPIQGFEEPAARPEDSKDWTPVSDRKIRVGIAGYGVCHFGAVFGFQDHPNVEVVGVTDLIPERCAALARATRCAQTYPSLEKMLENDRLEAVFVATDAPSHAQQCIDVLKRGKHVATAVPAVWGSLEDADRLFDVVKTSGRTYMMFETSCFHADLFAMRRIYDSGGFGKLVYCEGEYFHYMPEPIASFRNWRVGAPPQWYPTHATAYYVGASGGRFTEVSCMGMPSAVAHCKPENNTYRNPFGTEVALLRTSEGGTARMIISKDTPGAGGEKGRVRGQVGSFYGKYEGQAKQLPDVSRPPLPPSVNPGGHGGSHGHLMNEFVLAILQSRKPLIGIAEALNMTVGGIVAHQSALKDGELMKVPQYPL